MTLFLSHETTFTKAKKGSVRWRGPRRVTKYLHDYAFQVEDDRNGERQAIHKTRLRFYADHSLDTTAILYYVLASEAGMPVSRLLQLVEDNGSVFVSVRWKGLSPTEDTLEPLHHVYEGVPQLLFKLLHRKTTNADLRIKACIELGLEEGECNV